MASHGASNHVARVLSVANQSGQRRARVADCQFLATLPDQPQARSRAAEATRNVDRIRDQARLRADGGLIRFAIPELEDLARVLRDSGYCVNFADTNGTMLVSRLPGGDYERMFRELEDLHGLEFLGGL